MKNKKYKAAKRARRSFQFSSCDLNLRNTEFDTRLPNHFVAFTHPRLQFNS